VSPSVSSWRCGRAFDVFDVPGVGGRAFDVFDVPGVGGRVF